MFSECVSNKTANVNYYVLQSQSYFNYSIGLFYKKLKEELSLNQKLNYFKKCPQNQ